MVSGIVSDNGACIENCVNNASIIAYVNGGDGNYRHFIGGIVGNNFNQRGGYLKNSSNTGEGFGVGGIAGGSYLLTSGCYNTGNISLTGAKNTTTGGAGGMMGIIRGGNITNCYNTGNIISDGKKTGGLAGQTMGGDIVNSYNTGEITGPQAADFYAGGLVGYSDSTVQKSYSTGKITNETTNTTATDGQGGLVGHGSKNFTNCFYVNARKAKGAGDGNVGGTISLANIKDSSNWATAQAKQGDDNCVISLANASEFESMGLNNATALGVNFKLTLPAASSFISSATDVATIEQKNGAFHIITSKGVGGKTVISAKLQLQQNELDYSGSSTEKTYCGAVKNVEVPINLDFNAVNIILKNTTGTSALESQSYYALKANVAGKGVDNLNGYTLSWQFVKGDTTYTQDNPPAETHTGGGMTTLGAPTIAAEAYTWRKSSDPSGTETFKAGDAGWYRLNAKDSTTGYSFNSGWQYTTVDDLMIFNEDATNEVIEISAKDSATSYELKSKVEIVTGFSGTVTYAWYHRSTKIQGTEKVHTVITGDLPSHTPTFTHN